MICPTLGGDPRVSGWHSRRIARAICICFQLVQNYGHCHGRNPAIPPAAQFRSILRILIANKRLGLQLKSINR